MRTTSQNTTSQGTSQVWDIRGQNLPTPKPLYIFIYIYRRFVRFFGRLPHPLTSPFWEFGRIFGRTLFLTAAPILAGVLSAGASLTAPNYEPTFCPIQGTSVFRTRVRPFPVSGFSLETTKMNQRTETAGTTSPRPWKIECRWKKATKTCHHQTYTHVLVDANGRDVWHTFANMRLICDAVNGNC